MKLWSSRFDKDISTETLNYTHTVDIDERMIASDVWGNLAHVLMLSRQQIISPSEGRALTESLMRMLSQAEAGQLHLDKELEDVHLNIETAVIKELGIEIGGKMHTARSRNDQVVTDARLYLREEIIWLGQEILGFANELLQKARGHRQTLMLGHTHSQPAQPISYAFWLSCYSSIFARDARRLLNTYATVNRNPLGACALAGTSFPIDRNVTTKLLAFDDVILHALDATSSRDFIIETAATLAIIMSNISRLCEELVSWSGFEHGQFDVGDEFATGSSIMPQKKNPVVVELARARCGVAYGSLFELLTVVKSVSLGYSCDLQQDKPPLWRALDTTKATLSILRAQMARLKYDSERAIADCWNSFSTATELANYLVVKKGKPFREAYQIIGAIVKQLSVEGKTLADVSRVSGILMSEGIEIQPEELHAVVDPVRSIQRQRSAGSTGPEAVAETIDQLTSELERLGASYSEKLAAIQHGLARTKQAALGFVAGQELESLLAD